MSQATEDTTTTRRSVLSGLAVSAMVTPAALASTSEADAELLALVKAHNDLDAEYGRVVSQDDDDPRLSEITKEQDDLAEQIIDWRATTLEGLRAKASATRLHVDRNYAGTAPGPCATIVEFMAWSLADDLDRFGGPLS